MARGGVNAWTVDEHGNDVAPELQSQFMDWLLSDVRVPPSQADWAREHDLAEKTLSRWKKDDRFRKMWEKRASEKNVGIERVQAVLDVIYQAAVGGDMKAAESYMRYVERIMPPAKVDRAPEGLEVMSDEELAALAQSVLTDAPRQY